MDLENKLEEFITNNLTIETIKEMGSYGSQSYITIRLNLSGKVISETHIEIDE
jgi:hypothetical protein